MAKISNNLIKNFGKIKEVYNNILTNNIIKENKSGKADFSGYLNKIKSNEILKKQFLIYTNIENKIETDRVKAVEFINETISLISNHSKKDIFDANSKLINDIVFEKDLQYEKAELHENIAKLIFTEKDFNTIETIIETKNKIVDYIINNKPKEVNENFGLPNSMVTSIFIEKFNDKYSGLDESERKVLKVLIESNDEDKKLVYNDLVRECINLIDAKFIDSDIELKDKLLKVKDKLLSEKVDEVEALTDKITKVLNLRNTLK
jgi:hypothetical protein